MSDEQTPLHFRTQLRYICVYIGFTHDMCEATELCASCALQVIDSKAGYLELSCVLQCTSGEVQGHLRAFHKAMETSSSHAAYMSGVPFLSGQVLCGRERGRGREREKGRGKEVIAVTGDLYML